MNRSSKAGEIEEIEARLTKLERAAEAARITVTLPRHR
jgi:hypothetical protein